MNALAELREMGYAVTVEPPDGLRLVYQGEAEPDAARVVPLVAWLKKHKGDVVRALLGDRPPATMAEARHNVEAVFPGCVTRGSVLSPAGWRRAFSLCPPGRERERLTALWHTGDVEAEDRDGTLYLVVRTDLGAKVTIRAGDSAATRAVMAAFEDQGDDDRGAEYQARPGTFTDDQGKTWAYSPAHNAAFCRETGERKNVDDFTGWNVSNPQYRRTMQ